MGGSEVKVSGWWASTENTENTFTKDDGRLHHIAVAVNGTSVKVCLDAERVANDPDGVERPIEDGKVGMGLSSNRYHHQRVMFTNFRLAEGGRDIKSALATDGKIVTHGILFDTGSDRIKPESLPTLKKILAILEGDPALKFSIEGHTDNQGKKGVNQPLSERRAGAVQAWLQGQGVAAERLQAKGHGDANPIDTNDTAEGRANRRANQREHSDPQARASRLLR